MLTSRGTRLFRISRVALHLVRGLATAVLFPFQNSAARSAHIRRWSARLIALLGVTLHVHGKPHVERPLMLVANHVSWLDIFAIDSVVATRFVAKSEIRSWPLLGWLCARAGTLFIERSRRRDIQRVNAEVGAVLAAGEVFGVFAEGTTTDGLSVAKFHSSLLAPALDANAYVQPVAIRYERSDGSTCIEAAYDGDKSFLDTLGAMLTQREIVARVWFLPVLTEVSRDRRELTGRTREAIALTLFPEAPNTRTARAGDLRV